MCRCQLLFKGQIVNKENEVESKIFHYILNFSNAKTLIGRDLGRSYNSLINFRLSLSQNYCRYLQLMRSITNVFLVYIGI